MWQLSIGSFTGSGSAPQEAEMDRQTLVNLLVHGSRMAVILVFLQQFTSYLATFLVNGSKIALLFGKKFVEFA